MLPTPEEAALLAVLARGLAAQALDVGAPVADREPEVLRAWLWCLARDDLTGRCVHPRAGKLMPAWQIVNELVAELGPWLGEENEFVNACWPVRGRGGTGAERQRTTHDRSGQFASPMRSGRWPGRADPECGLPQIPGSRRCFALGNDFLVSYDSLLVGRAEGETGGDRKLETRGGADCGCAEGS